MPKRQPFIWFALTVFKKICRLLPHKAAVGIGAGLGAAVGFFSGKRAAKAVRRCMRILEITEKEAFGIVARAYRNFGRSLVEFIRLPLMLDSLPQIVALHGEENLKKAFSKGKGVIFLSCHIGNWEYAAALLAGMGYPMSAIGAEQRDERITDEIADLRQTAGVNPVGKGLDLKAAISALKRGEALAVLLDQDAKDAGVIVPFLGKPASTPIGPLKLSRKLGSPVVPAHIIRRDDGITFDMYIEPELGNASIPFGEDIAGSAGLCNDVISGWIRKNPDQWMWMYPRWASTLNDR